MSAPFKGGASGLLAAIAAGDEAKSRILLQQCNDAYYGDGSSPLTDAEFDEAQRAYTARFGLALKTAPRIGGERRPIDGFPGYEVTSDGNIMSYWSQAGKIGTTAHAMSVHQDKDGYRQLVLMRDGKRSTKRIAAIVATAFIGSRPSNEHVVRHLDGDNTNDSWTNLAWGTQAENIADREQHGTTARGEQQGLSVLTEEQVREIIAQRGIETQDALALRFGVSKSQISNIHQGRQWRHVSRSDRHANVPHDWPFLSGWLAKAAGKEELLNWYAKRLATPTVTNTQVGSPKWDGMSIVVTYDRYGNVQRALTRGDDGLGVDVTRLFAGECHFRDYDAEVRFGVKYEIVLAWSALDKLNSELELELKNPRNTVAGIVASDDSATRRKYVTLVPLDIEWDGCEASRIERLELMQSLFCPPEDESGNAIAPAIFTGNGDRETPFFFWTAETVEEIQAIYDEVHSWRDRDDFEYMIDGVVFEFAALEDIELLGGRQSDCPDYAIAAKFPSMTGRTRVVSIDFDLGNTGRLTPVVNYEPITMDGRTFSRTSISNFVRFDALKLCVGTPIIVEIRGDVLGWIDRDGEDPKGATPIEFVPPEGCHFTHNKQGQRVFALVDAPLDGRCERMMIKCGVKSVRIETIAKLVQAGVVARLADMWTVSDRYDRIVAIPGLGESSADILCSAIEGKLRGGLWDWEILASVGIAGVGRTLSKEALKVWSLSEMVGSITIPDTPAMPSASALSAALVPNIGPERTRMLIEGIAAKVDDLQELMALGEFKSIKAAQAGISDGQKFKVVVTGDLNHWERDEFKDYIESLGHKMVGSVSSKTDLLITNTPNSGTVKNKRARELGVRIVTELEAVEVMGLTLPGKGTSSEPAAALPGETVDLDDL